MPLRRKGVGNYVVDNDVDQLFGAMQLNKRWIIEASGKFDWRMIDMMLSDRDHGYIFTGRDPPNFMNKRESVEPGLELADLTVNLFAKHGPPAVFAGPKAKSPRYERLYRAAFGSPMPPLMLPPGRRSRLT